MNPFTDRGEQNDCGDTDGNAKQRQKAAQALVKQGA